MSNFLKKQLFVVMALAVALPNLALSQPMRDMGARGLCGTGSPFGMPPHHHRGMPQGRTMPPLPIDLALTETQLDKIFDIMHASAPAIREKIKVIRASHMNLRKLTLSREFDETKARSLIETSTKARAELALLRAKNCNRIINLLTDAQYEKFQKQTSIKQMSRKEKL